MDPDVTRLGVALGLGLLVGLQRERSQSRVAGIRTFGLIALFGALSGLLAGHFDHPWGIVGGVIALAVLLAVANILKKREGAEDAGQTTEVAALLMYVTSAYLMLGSLTIGIVAGAAMSILLYLRGYFSRQIGRLGEKDLHATMVFVAISLVILPILPSDPFGPYEVLSLREIWLMVVLIVGISLTGYFAYKGLGRRLGAGLSGILGGMVSSTATTVACTRQTRENPALCRLAVFVITIASAMAFIRILVEVAIIAPEHLIVVAPPILVVLGVNALTAALLYFFVSRQAHEPVPDPKNPAQFMSALVFGLLYAVVLVLIAFAKDTLGPEGLYAVAILSGLTDMDAITLSLANLMSDGRILPERGWRLILTAGLANLVFKMGLVAALGDRRLLQRSAWGFGAVIASGVSVLVMW